MEALAALGVAAAVIQFLDFSSKLVSKGQQLFHSTDGALLENKEMEHASERLKKLTEPLQISMQGDDAILAICRSCIDVSNELITCIAKLKMQDGHLRSRWKSFRQALKSVLSKREVKDLKLRLDNLRSELGTHATLHIQSDLSSMYTQHDGRFNSLDSAAQENMALVTNCQRRIREDLGNQFQHLLRTEHLEHDRTRADFSDTSRIQLETRVQQTIVESLCFQSMTVRHDAIPEAHQRTFEWIFRDPVGEGKPWGNFREWLKSGEGIYWIDGKAGSGKSTLVKFIVDHEKTQKLLGTWAQGTSLETPSFFFWKSGEPDQRSQEGLLRSLLYEVLRNHSELVSSVFPDLWSKYSKLASNNVTIPTSKWTLTKLKQAFTRLVACCTLRICFFIDGLDEYEGDHEELAKYFSQLSYSTYIKLCLSSRPWPAFEEVFRARPRLKLQDLTEVDIEQYVNDQFNSNRNMLVMRQREPERTKSLFDDLIRKANGVFLWVSLVVKSLLKGLLHKNSMYTLAKRLDSMPPDLENLYSHMLSSVDPLDMEEGSKIFQIRKHVYGRVEMEVVYRALRVTLPESSNALLSNADETSERLRANQFELINQEMELILQAACGGLIEIHVEEAEADLWASGRLDYIHRTVSDYLDNDEIWATVISYNHLIKWDPRMALLRSCVDCVKDVKCFGIESRRQSIAHVFGLWGIYVTEVRNYFPHEEIPCDDIIILLDQFDKYANNIAVSCQWYQPTCVSDIYEHWTNLDNEPWAPVLPHQGFLSFTAQYGIWSYVQRQLQGKPSLGLRRESDLPLLAYPILANQDPDYVMAPIEELVKTIQVILSASADPNEQIFGHSIWQYWLTIIHTAVDESSLQRVTLDILQRGTVDMLKAGADLKATCIEGSKVWHDLLHGHLEQKPELASDIWIFCGATSVTKLMKHSQESWRTPGEHPWVCQIERAKFTGRENLEFGARHCLKAVIEDAFREHLPEGADGILQLIEELEAEKSSEKCEYPAREKKRKMVEEELD